MQVASARRRNAVAPEVFGLCSRGRYHMFRYTADDATKSLKYYRLAAEKDPAYAPAFAGLCWAYIQHAEFGLMPNSLAWPKAREAAERAVQLDDSSFEAHVALGDIQFWAWDWTSAEQSFKRALALNPPNVESLGTYRNFLGAMGRLDESPRAELPN